MIVKFKKGQIVPKWLQLVDINRKHRHLVTFGADVEFDTKTRIMYSNCIRENESYLKINGKNRYNVVVNMNHMNMDFNRFNWYLPRKILIKMENKNEKIIGYSSGIIINSM